MVSDRVKVPNLVLRRIREEERQESRSEFAEAMARVARKNREPVSPSERYVARLEDGDVRYPSPPYRRVLSELCQRPIAELGFVPRYLTGTGTARDDDKSSLAFQVSPAGLYVSTGGGLLPGSHDHLAFAGGTAESRVAGPVSPDELVAASEWPVWFGIRLAHMIGLVDNWRDPAAELGPLQALLHQEVQMFDATAPEGQGASSALHAFSRRQTLMTLAALPLTLTASGGALRSSAATEYFLTRCAASLTACWHLLRGSDLPAVEQMVSRYLLALDGIAQQESRYQQGAALLASQAHRISGIVALHRDQLRVRELHCKQALLCATVAEDASSQASALLSLGDTYFYGSEPARAAVAYERAADLEAEIPQLQRSRVHAELAVVYGQMRREQDAIRSAGLAEEVYPDDPERDPSFLYAEFAPAYLTLEQGLAYLALAEQYPGRGYQQQAAGIFARIDRETSEAPDRIRLEIINHQAMAAVLLNDLDAFETYLCRALDGAVLLASRQRQREIRTAWGRAIQTWPREPRLKVLSDGLQLAADSSAGEPA
jgi:tetratricopeptide (TPR) repeat protein